MALSHPAAARLKGKFPALGLKGAEFRGQAQIAVPRDHFIAVLTYLKDEPTLAYDFLADVSCVDYLGYPGAQDRFGLTYILSTTTRDLPRLILRVYLNEPELEVDSVVPLYAGAEWLEREVFDMFGIRFRGHPDLRRILTWDGFGAYPLRKDYPVTGKGERENYPVITRDSA
jgi:NADH-quinone oxidoreductase subunit C